jgi:hypothetical protein
MLYDIGQSQSPYQNSSLLQWEDSEKNSGQFQPYISHLPVNLCGQDILKDMGLLILSPNQKVTQMILSQGFDPRAGLGAQRQGITQPIEPIQKTNCHGLGFQKFS